jgi:ankyrin repeat protein
MTKDIYLTSLIGSAMLIQEAKYNGNKKLEDVAFKKLKNFLLYMACARGSRNETKRLLSRADVNFVNDDEDRRTPLHAASIEGRLDIVKMLHKKRRR